MSTTPSSRTRVFKRLETDSELRARLAKSPRYPSFMWQLHHGGNLDSVADGMGLPRRIVEVEA